MNQNSKEKIQQIHFFNSPPRVGPKIKTTITTEICGIREI